MRYRGVDLQMKDFLKNKYQSFFSSKGYSPQLSEDGISFFCSDHPLDAPEFLSEIEFNTEELTFFAEHLPVGERVSLRNFLSFLLKNKRYDSILTFLGKMLVSQIGKTQYKSKNVSSFNIAERSFDRFIEAVLWTELPFEYLFDLCCAVLKSEKDSALSRWKRPVIDYILGTLIKKEKQFYEFVFKHFSEYGIVVFDTLISKNVSNALPRLVHFWLYNEFDEKRQVKNILKQHFIEVRRYISGLEKEHKIKTSELVELLLIFKNEKDANQMLQEIYFKEKDDEIKKRIVENIHIHQVKTVNLAQIKKNGMRLNSSKDTVFLNTALSHFPQLKLHNNTIAEVELVGYFLHSYKTLCSPKASFEVGYFNKIFEPQSLDSFCLFISDQLIKSKKDEWAFCLIAQNATPKSALDIAFKFSDNQKEFPQGLNLFIKQYIFEHKEESSKFFDSLNKENIREKKVLDVFLKQIIVSDLFEPLEVEALRDKMVPNFELVNGKMMVDDFTLTIEKDGKVTVHPDIEDKPKKVEIEQKRLSREVERQVKRFYIAFNAGRLWTFSDWQKYILEQPLMLFFAQRLLWAKYGDGRIITVFKIQGKDMVNLASIESDITEDYMIGIFHPVEFTEQNWMDLFEAKQAPFNQLYREVFPLSNYTSHASVVSHFNGMIVNTVNFFERMERSGWKIGVPSLDNEVKSIISINKELNLLSELDFSPINKGSEESSLVLGELRFYRLNTVLSTGNNWITNKTNSLELGAVKERYFSDVIFDIHSAGKR